MKQYYTFADTLAVDKYDIDGVNQDTVIAAREINLEGNDNRNWVNDHTVYTHGYGIVAAYGNKVTSDGQPQFFEYGIPTQGYLTDTQHYEPRIYFSPEAPEYSIVARHRARSPGNSTIRRFRGSHHHLQWQWWPAHRQHLLQAHLFDQVRFRPDPVLRPCERGFPDSLRSFPPRNVSPRSRRTSPLTDECIRRW